MNRLPAALALVLFAAGCPLPEKDPLPDWDVDQDDTGDTGDTDTGDTDTAVDTDTADTAIPDEPIGLYGVLGLGYDVRMWGEDTNDPCEIEIDGTIAGYQSLDCTLDINELDLFGNGLDFDLVVPFGACDYIVWHHYMYEVWEVGQGPTAVDYTIDANGNVIDGPDTLNGVPICDYNYHFGFDDAPNCCTGTYTLTIDNLATQTSDSIGPINWGGNPADCYDGAAYYDPEAQFSPDGWPLGRIVFLDQDYYEKRFHWPLLAARYVSNVPLANYFDPADHEEPDTAAPAMPAGLAAEYAVPYYMFQCYDHAEELLGQIRLTVREWNEQEEFYAIGDPDTTGTEPLSDTPIDDRADWAVATAGNHAWIGFAQ